MGAIYLLAIDQGTTSSRAMLFKPDLACVATAQRELTQHFPAAGLVEHDANEILAGVIATCREVMAKAGVKAADIAAVGITNQRETTVVWDRATGQPIHRAIVWQDRRTALKCAELRAAGHEDLFQRKTGLVLDPYFSGTKLAWILSHVPGARRNAELGKLAFGTVDSFLIWHLTGGRVHATDATNASRTLMYDIHQGEWDPHLLEILQIPQGILPEIKDCAGDYGMTEASFLGESIPIRGVAGDQHAAAIGQACFEPGMMKSTYGTGCFALLNTGTEAIASRNKLLTTVAYQLDGKRTYALEGSIFIAGAAVQWLRDGLKIIGTAPETSDLAASADPGQDVILVPAFTGLGAPYWDAECRGAMFGLTRATTAREMAKAALEAACFQTADLLAAMHADWQGAGGVVLRVDGGMSASDWTMQRLADVTGGPVDRPVQLETTAMGAAYLAGLATGLCPAPQEFAKSWRSARRFEPALNEAERNARLAAWHDAVARTLTSPRTKTHLA